MEEIPDHICEAVVHEAWDKKSFEDLLDGMGAENIRKILIALTSVLEEHKQTPMALRLFRLQKEAAEKLYEYSMVESMPDSYLHSAQAILENAKQVISNIEHNLRRW